MVLSSTINCPSCGEQFLTVTIRHMKGFCPSCDHPITKQAKEIKKTNGVNCGLANYIKEHHNNNQSDFARSQGVSQSQARRWLKRNCVVIDGLVYCEVSKQKEKESDDV